MPPSPDGFQQARTITLSSSKPFRTCFEMVPADLTRRSLARSISNFRLVASAPTMPAAFSKSVMVQDQGRRQGCPSSLQFAMSKEVRLVSVVAGSRKKRQKTAAVQNASATRARASRTEAAIHELDRANESSSASTGCLSWLRGDEPFCPKYIVHCRFKSRNIVPILRLHGNAIYNAICYTLITYKFDVGRTTFGTRMAI